MHRGEVNPKKIMEILNRYRGNLSWNKTSDRLKINRSIIFRIKNGSYKPGYTILMRLACVAPLEERNAVYNELLSAAGLVRISLDPKG